MDTPAATTDAAPAPAPAPAQKPGRKPLDPAAREAAAIKAKTRQMAKKLSKASNAEEFWTLAEELAEKSGRKPLKVAAGEEKSSEPDPLDMPMAPKWPTPRQMAVAEPYVTAGVGMLADVLEDTRYGVLSVPLMVPGPGGEKIEIDRKAILIKPVTACAALMLGDKEPEMHPGWALVIASAFIFGPPAAAHAWEHFGPRVSAWWGAGKTNTPAPQVAQAETGPKLVRKSKEA